MFTFVLKHRCQRFCFYLLSPFFPGLPVSHLIILMLSLRGQAESRNIVFLRFFPPMLIHATLSQKLEHNILPVSDSHK